MFNYESLLILILKGLEFFIKWMMEIGVLAKYIKCENFKRTLDFDNIQFREKGHPRYRCKRGTQ